MSLYHNQYIINVHFTNNTVKLYIILSNQIKKLYEIFEHILDNVYYIFIEKFFDNKFNNIHISNFDNKNILNNYERQLLYNWISNEYKFYQNNN